MAAGARVSPPNPRNDSKGKLNGKVEFEGGTRPGGGMGVCGSMGRNAEGEAVFVPVPVPVPVVVVVAESVEGLELIPELTAFLDSREEVVEEVVEATGESGRTN